MCVCTLYVCVRDRPFPSSMDKQKPKEKEEALRSRTDLLVFPGVSAGAGAGRGRELRALRDKAGDGRDGRAGSNFLGFFPGRRAGGFGSCLHVHRTKRPRRGVVSLFGKFLLVMSRSGCQAKKRRRLRRMEAVT